VLLVSIISRFIEEPSTLHLAAAKKSCDIFKGHKIMYKKQEDNRLIGFIDNDWVGSYDDKKSYILCMRTNMIS
jgi:hypothetical protein